MFKNKFLIINMLLLSWIKIKMMYVNLVFS